MTDITTISEQGYDATEVANSLTGYDEIGVRRAFGSDVGDLSGTFQWRACAFVLFKRQGQDHDAAYDSAMQLTLAQCEAMFTGHDDEPMPEEPVTPAGKDEPQPGETPMSSPASSS